MTPESLRTFFEASAGVAGALIGLLFVVISVAQERLSSPDASQAHRVRASAALTAFTNALTISLFGLLPGEKLGGTAVAISVIGLLFIAASLLSLLRVSRNDKGELRDALFLVGLLVVFALQLWYGLSLLRHATHAGTADGIAVLVIVCFLIGITRAWELIGGPQIGLRKEVTAIVRTRSQQDDGGSEEDGGS